MFTNKKVSKGTVPFNLCSFFRHLPCRASSHDQVAFSKETRLCGPGGCRDAPYQALPLFVLVGTHYRWWRSSQRPQKHLRGQGKLHQGITVRVTRPSCPGITIFTAFIWIHGQDEPDPWFLTTFGALLLSRCHIRRNVTGIKVLDFCPLLRNLKS